MIELMDKMTIGLFVTFLGMTVAGVWLYGIIVDGRAADLIEAKKLEIEATLAFHGVPFNVISPSRDPSPCELRYSIVIGAKAGLRPVVFLKHMKELKLTGDIIPLMQACLAANAAELARRRKRASL